MGLTKKVFSSVKRPHPKSSQGEKGLKVLSFGEDSGEAILFGQPVKVFAAQLRLYYEMLS